MSKPSLPQGTRDFAADTIRKRQYIFTTIKCIFERYGFQPLETPAMENLETLMGKYGEEGDRLIFKILNNGLNDPKNAEKAKQGFDRVLEGKSSALLTERALKYDLTIPFARYVAMNHGQLTFPYKRYQIQPVWRADRPQKGRYREFTQCDADVVGSNALLNEVELTNIYHDVFLMLGLNGYQLLVNHRKILTALAGKCGGDYLLTDITVAIDKLDKIGWEKVKEELTHKNISEQAISVIHDYLCIDGSNQEKINKILALLGNDVNGSNGIEDLKELLESTRNINIHLDFSLARGLNYYTGTIFEVKPPEAVRIGSIGGGGRYDDLTGLFGVPGIPGVGISFGVDRIYDVLEELQLFPNEIQTGTMVMFLNMGKEESKQAYTLMQGLRIKGISCEMYHEPSKLDKQFKYADKKGFRYAIILGSKELESKHAVVKKLNTGEQNIVPIDSIADAIS